MEVGNTVLEFEHNLDVFKTAVVVKSLGPEGGDGGGQELSLGLPVEVSEVADSTTGQTLKPVLIRVTKRTKEAAAGSSKQAKATKTSTK